MHSTTPSTPSVPLTSHLPLFQIKEKKTLFIQTKNQNKKPSSQPPLISPFSLDAVAVAVAPQSRRRHRRLPHPSATCHTWDDRGTKPVNLHAIFFFLVFVYYDEEALM
ncbi:hypothetical protein QJS10_CPB22g01213 [Acorus calamus]|uniref:Uncharacterized protein n=1 Tax=Acorus calamus TaxID=4465 RepID=A0AAV9C2S0_ACOCL|nr:hypothetical protein QJS10_CPB22g01213 [Acorus calamus]